MSEKQDTYLALARIAKSRLVNTNAEDMTMVALAFWHEGFVPDVEWAKALDPKGQLVVGYVVEFLAGFNVLCGEERDNLLSVADNLRPFTPLAVEPDEYRDELATEWGLEQDITPYFEYISHYQTRHYIHKSDYKRPSGNFVL